MWDSITDLTWTVKGQSGRLTTWLNISPLKTSTVSPLVSLYTMQRDGKVVSHADVPVCCVIYVVPYKMKTNSAALHHHCTTSVIHSHEDKDHLLPNGKWRNRFFSSAHSTQPVYVYIPPKLELCISGLQASKHIYCRCCLFEDGTLSYFYRKRHI